MCIFVTLFMPSHCDAYNIGPLELEMHLHTPHKMHPWCNLGLWSASTNHNASMMRSWCTYMNASMMPSVMRPCCINVASCERCDAPEMCPRCILVRPKDAVAGLELACGEMARKVALLQEFITIGLREPRPHHC